MWLRYVRGKNDFAERNFAGYKSENNFVETLKIMSNAAKNFDIEFERST